jgi:hypothetical protein
MAHGHGARAGQLRVEGRETGLQVQKKTVDVDIVEIHAPRLRHVRYKGPLCSFSFSPQPLDLEQVDLDFLRHRNIEDPPDHDYFETFWRFARSFASTKEMTLRVNYLENIAVLSEARRVELLPTFRRLRRLEVQAVDGTKGKAAALTILNLTDDASNEKGVPDTHIPEKEIQIACSNACRPPLRGWACNSG